ncbi:uncharacterized protein LOC127846646 [Dreissena polymorpha]|uniref:uncharacterized protein LOC127846646 n=1 Tax=Dreissena polymorpha TaxID=45954 RepID=UPI002263CCA5|nr:uncharacterized protein LOC127846646 [Dreissena polymorpha]
MAELLRNSHNRRQSEYLGSACLDIGNTHSELSDGTDIAADFNSSHVHLQSQHRVRSYSFQVNRKKLNDIGRERWNSNRTRRKSVGSSDSPDVFEQFLSVPCNPAFLEESNFKSKEMDGSGSSNSDDGNYEENRRVRRARSFRERPERASGELRRVRSFKTTSKGLVNRGDSFKTRKGATEFVAASSQPGVTVDSVDGDNTYLLPPVVMTKTEEQLPKYYRVLLLGAEGVGKSSIINQFMTSEFLGGGNFNISQSEDDRTVTLQVDGEETTLEFVQSEDFQENVENLSLDAFVVVFSTTDRIGFDQAVEVLKQLREEVGAHKAIILVGNKADLARKRKIPADEGRSAADGYDCKYIETSAALNHRVDELLVGIHKQIMLKCHSINSNALETPPTKQKHRTSSFKRTKRFLEKIFLGNSDKDNTTENLYVE